MDLQDLEQFGADLLERKTEIDKKCESAIPTFPLEFMGKPMKLKVIDVRIGFPVYRLANGRTSTYQLQYLAQHSDLDSDFFKRDNDSITAQMAQNEILLRLIDDENLLKAFKESELQIEPILCTNTGVVVNGNRRLCAWRKLYLSDQVKYKNFQTVEVAILPECDEKAIKTLEKKLQISKTKRAEYKWHAKAMMAEEELKNGGKLPEVAKGYGMSPQKMQEMISKKNYAEKYLKLQDRANQWSDVDADEYAFEKLTKNIKKFKDSQGDQELFEQVVFTLIKKGSTEGRLYDVIDEMADNFEEIKKKLNSQYCITDLKSISNDKANQKSDTGVLTNTPIAVNVLSGNQTGNQQQSTSSSDSKDDEHTVDLNTLAGQQVTTEKSSQVASVIKNADDQTQTDMLDTIRNVINTQKAVQSEVDSANYLLNQLAKAAALLTGAVNQGLRENTATDGIDDQINTIEENIRKINNWLANGR